MRDMIPLEVARSTTRTAALAVHVASPPV